MMRYKLLGISFFAASLAFPVYAQDVYDIENLVSNDLNGTARYVGMGGAMSALGADISVMRSNPAGIGLYRRGDFATSASIVHTPNGTKFAGHSNSNFSFDNLGFVYSINTESKDLKYVNIGFSYQRKRNFNMNFSAANNNLNGLSQTGMLADLNTLGLLTPLGQIAGDRGLITERALPGDRYTTDWYLAYGNQHKSMQYGGVQEFDINLSFNYYDRLYLGFTVGSYEVDYNHYAEYSESFLPGAFHADYIAISDRRIFGSGVDAKFGAIYRPVEYSPFRIGLAISTPTYYNLTTRTYAEVVTTNDNVRSWMYLDDVEYDIRSPWTLNLSLGHTISNFIALGAEYEYQNYGSTRLQYNGYNDVAMHKEIDLTLQSTHTFKIGAEVKLIDGFYFRAGYNYVSSAFQNNAFRNQYADSFVMDFASSTDYTNKSDTRRVTLGLGTRGKKWYGDFAFQYNKQSGKFYAFDDYYNAVLEQNGSSDHIAAQLSPTKVSLDRMQFLFTLGRKF